MATPVLKYISAPDYLTTECRAAEQHEYFNGEMFAISDASLKHNRVFANSFGSFAQQLKDRSCRPYGNTLHIPVPWNPLYTYPDSSIICGQPQITDTVFDTIASLSAIFEGLPVD